jgi:hypothetical protein
VGGKTVLGGIEERGWEEEDERIVWATRLLVGPRLILTIQSNYVEGCHVITYSRSHRLETLLKCIYQETGVFSRTVSQSRRQIAEKHLGFTTNHGVYFFFFAIF